MLNVQVNGNDDNKDSNDNEESNDLDERHLPLLFCRCR